MRYHLHEDEVKATEDNGMAYKSLITGQQGAVNEFVLGVTEYYAEEYQNIGLHETQEGFYVLAGVGTARVGDTEFPIRAGTSFIAPKGVPHSVKKSPGSVPVRLIWAHGAVERVDNRMLTGQVDQ